MLLTLMKCKLHNGAVTEARLDYEGSITIGRELIKASGLVLHEKVDVLNITNGVRFSTYVIEGDKGDLCVNGAAARLVAKGDRIIVIAYAHMTPDEAKKHEPKIILLDEKNRIKK
jgi:aspartate 1-decarboxylase